MPSWHRTQVCLVLLPVICELGVAEVKPVRDGAELQTAIDSTTTRSDERASKRAVTRALRAMADQSQAEALQRAREEGELSQEQLADLERQTYAEMGESMGWRGVEGGGAHLTICHGR